LTGSKSLLRKGDEGIGENASFAKFLVMPVLSDELSSIPQPILIVVNDAHGEIPVIVIPRDEPIRAIVSEFLDKSLNVEIIQQSTEPMKIPDHRFLSDEIVQTKLEIRICALILHRGLSQK